MTKQRWVPLVGEIKAELASYSWFEKLGQPDPSICNRRADFAWMVEKDAFRYGGWGAVLHRVEAPIDDALRARSDGLDLRDLVNSELKLTRVLRQEVLDQFFIDLDDRYGNRVDGVFAGTGLYPHEIVQLPQRLITYAALDRCLSSERSPVLNEAMSLLSRGFWPAGWDGKWPKGDMIVW